MKFSEIVTQAVTLLHESQRITYRALKREFALDDELLDDLKDELIVARRVARDEDGTVLVWVGDEAKGETAKRGKGEDSPESRHVQSPESKIQYSFPK